MDEVRVGIVGHGFVGGAVDKGFNCDKFIVDPKLDTKIEQLEAFEPTHVFVCVPTPSRSDGSIDSSLVEEAVFKLAQFSPKPVIIVKSTITPDVAQKLLEVTDYVYNPEFLREAHADYDFVNQAAVILGAPNEELCKSVADLYIEYSSIDSFNTEFFFLRTVDAAFIKYATNTFLATKVMFFNQLKRLYELSGGVDWDLVTQALSRDARIGSSHMQVPGPDGRLGFGGACFPKDTAALLRYAEKTGAALSILNEVVESNRRVRAKYTELLDREKEQNVKF